MVKPRLSPESRASQSPFTPRVGAAPDVIWGPLEGRSSRLRVALLGFGAVGRGVYERLAAQPDRFEILMVASRHPARHVRSGLPGSLATNVLERSLLADVDLVIECLGGVAPAGSLMHAALAMGKSVVTANKTAVVGHWPKLAEYARGADRTLWYSAAVGGSVPVLETIESLNGRIVAVHGVINGTCNAVLDALARGESLEVAVRAAQAAGFAEADPSQDLSGADAAHKLSLIAHAAFGTPVNPEWITRAPVEAHLVAQRGQVWRQVARAVSVNGDMTLSVLPELVPSDSFIGRTQGAENRLEFTLTDCAIARLSGQGAGRWPTATAVMGDVQAIVRRRARIAIQR